MTRPTIGAETPDHADPERRAAALLAELVEAVAAASSNPDLDPVYRLLWGQMADERREAHVAGLEAVAAATSNPDRLLALIQLWQRRMDREKRADERLADLLRERLVPLVQEAAASTPIGAADRLVGLVQYQHELDFSRLTARAEGLEVARSVLHAAAVGAAENAAATRALLKVVAHDDPLARTNELAVLCDRYRSRAEEASKHLDATFAELGGARRKVEWWRGWAFVFAMVALFQLALR